jgi:uncharacterized protein YmfQ (DUF2313 family)
MGVMTIDAEAYARMLKLLLPPGRIWRTDPDSKLSAVMLASGDELARVSVRAKALVEEADPSTATELLAEYESMLDLSSDGTDAERRARIVALLVRRQRVRPVDYQQALALILGQDAADVVVIERGRAFAIAVDDDQEIYRFFIYRDPNEAGSYSIEDAQAIIDRMQQSHTQGHAIESIDFLCDDPFSLCDRDLLGGDTMLEVLTTEIGTAPSRLWLGTPGDHAGLAVLVADGSASYGACTTHLAPWGDMALRVTAGSTDTWTAPIATICDMDGTEAVCVIVAGYISAYAAGAITTLIGKRDEAADFGGWELAIGTTGNLLARIDAGAPPVTDVNLAATNTAPGWHVWIVRYDPDTELWELATELGDTSTAFSGSATSTVPVGMGAYRSVDCPAWEMTLLAEVRGAAAAALDIVTLATDLHTFITT